MLKGKGRCSKSAGSVASGFDMFVRSGETGDKPGDHAGVKQRFYYLLIPSVLEDRASFCVGEIQSQEREEGDEGNVSRKRKAFVKMFLP